MNKRGVIIAAVAFVVLFAGFISASVSLGSPAYSIAKSYSPGQELAGWINVSISGEPVTSYVQETGSENKISIQDLLDEQSSKSYSCIPEGCGLGFSTSGAGVSLLSFNLGAADSKTVGINITNQPGKKISSIDGFSLNVTSTATASSSPQLKISILNQSTTWESYKGSGTYLKEDVYGCYHKNAANLALRSLPSSTAPFCVNATSIQTSPKLIIGAYVNGSTDSQISFSIYDESDSAHSGSCTVEATGSGKISCTPKNDAGGNFSVSKEGNFDVCISYKQGSSGGDYKINSTPSMACGFAGLPPFTSSYTTAGFQIFASWEYFAPVGSFILNDTSIHDSGDLTYSAETSIGDYIQKNYNNDCSAGCIIPITFSRGEQNQDITLQNLSLKYTAGNFPYTSAKIYNLSQSPASLSTDGYQKIYIDGANFTAESSVGNHSLKLVFYDSTVSTTLVDSNYSVLDVPRGIVVSPLIIAALNPTKFTAGVSMPQGGEANITSYKWDFGDGSAVQTTTSNSVTHTYKEVKIFNMTVNVTNSAGLTSSKKFQISVLAPKEAVRQILSQKTEDLNRVKGQIANFSSSFSRNSLISILNLNQTETLLNNLTAANANAGASGASDEQYVNILQQLFNIDVPISVQQTQQANSIQFVPSENSISLDLLKTIGGGSYQSSKSKDYKDAIIAWDTGNIPATVDYSEFSSVSGVNESQPILNVVSVDVGANPSGGNAYLVIPALDNIMLDKNYQKSGDYYYLTLGNTPQTVQFATTQSISPVDLPIFIAPSLNQISISQGTSSSGNNLNKWLILAGVLGGIFFTAFIIYVILGKWYQKRYESYLFKNKNDLYNVVNYIHSSKTRGVENSEIERNLRRSKWSSEQISYIMKKYAGKGVGLPGFVKRVKKVKKANYGKMPRRH